MKLIVATTTPKLGEMIKSKGYDVVCETTSFSELQRIFGSSEAIGDTLLITENIQADGSVINGILKIHARKADLGHPSPKGARNKDLGSKQCSMSPKHK